MRFPFASLAAAMPRPAREIERADRIVCVRAPERWTDERLAAAGLRLERHLKAGAVHAHLLERAA